MLEMSGHFVCSTGQAKHDMIFILEINELKIPIEICLHTNSCYGYPYSIQKNFVMEKEGKMKILV